MQLQKLMEPIVRSNINIEWLEKLNYQLINEDIISKNKKSAAFSFWQHFFNISLKGLF
jgi:hypothetical protein